MEGLGLSRYTVWILLAANCLSGLARVPQLDVLERQKRQIYNPPEYVLGMNMKYEEGGPWGPWTLYSSCSRSCGGGVSFQTRICSGFRFDGTHNCYGPSRRYHSCNIQKCADDTDFRIPQCSRFNSMPFRGAYHSWIPVYDAPKPCELNCMPKGAKYYHRRGRKVIDGTPCYKNGTNDICIDGKCIPLPCDRILGSNAKVDKCGVCGGDDSTCHLISGIVDQEIYVVGYNDILLIPPHAMGIIIEEVTPNKNHFAIRSFTGQYYLNGNWQIEFSGTYMIGGAEFHYERNYDLSIPERIWSEGPTLEPLFISLVYQDPERNPGVRYEYTVPKDKELTPNTTYVWKTEKYQECSKTCGGGKQQRLVLCVRSTDSSKVEDNLCDIGKKPKQSKECNIQPCPASWHVGEWSQCSQSCASGIQYRLVYCEQLIQDGVLAVTNDQQCEQDDKPKPPFFQSCNKDVECPRWHSGPWTACNRICGPGNQTRVVTCEKGKQETVVLENSYCDLEKIPDSIKSCTIRPCEGVEWILTEWSGCTDKCGPQSESRQAYCANEKGEVFSDDLCSDKPIPKLTRPCPKAKPCTALWHTSEWSRCSAKCGTGVQTRVVFCGIWKGDSVRKVADTQCKKEKKFTSLRNCTRTPCKGSWFSGPWTKCSVPCGGGEKTRKILCLHKESVVSGSQCDPSTIPHNNETCNAHSCIEETTTESTRECFYSPYGCCPDGKTIAAPNVECPTEITEDCGPFGCCLDMKTPAKGPFRAGCPDIIFCNETKYGCCPDGLTEAKGKFNQGCSGISECLFSTHGCCSDNITAAKGPDMHGCPPDNVTAVPTTVVSPTSESIDVASKTDITSLTDITTIHTIESTAKISDTSKTAVVSTTMKVSSATPAITTAASAGTIMTPIVTEISSTMMGDVTSSTRETTMKSDATRTTLAVSTETETSRTEPTTISVTKTSAEESTMTSAITEGITTETTITSHVTGTTATLDKAETIISSSQKQTMETSSVETSSAIESTVSSTKGTSHTKTTGATAVTETTVTPDITKTTVEAGTGVISTSDKEMVTSGVTGTVISTGSRTTYSEIQTSHPTSSMTDSVTTAITSTDTITTLRFGTTGSATTSGETTAESVTSTKEITSISTEATSSVAETKMASLSTTVSMETSDSTTVLETADHTTIGATTTPSTTTGPPTTLPVSTGTMTTSSPESTITSSEATDLTAVSESKSVSITERITTVSSIKGTSPTKTSASAVTETTVTSDVTKTTVEAGTATTAESVTGSMPTETTLLQSLGSTEIASSTESLSVGSTTSISDNITGTMIQDHSSETSLADNITVSLLSDTSLQLENMTSTTSNLCNGTTCCPDMDANGTNCFVEGHFAKDFTPREEPNENVCANNANHSNKNGICCEKSQYGCCPDNITAATGENFKGCFKSPPGELSSCEKSTYGCCPDGVTVSPDENFIGCPCETFKYGCCDDKVTPRLGPDNEGCCFSSEFGCCPDNKTSALREEFAGCPCSSLEFGCCRDNILPAIGPNQEGCECEYSIYECCEDGLTMPTGPDFEGCLCHEMIYGCCPDNFTAARNAYGEGCRCQESRYGCCPDEKTAAKGLEYFGCPCSTLIFGCCADGKTPAHDIEKSTCPCNTTEYGCCPNGITHAAGPNYAGCPCETTKFGCCADGKTAATGFYGAGCEDCSRLSYGCCPDNRTVAKGRDFEGCPCNTFPYGCCPDGKTPALGPNSFGCSCGLYGCCPDGKTPAQGPNDFGCSCGLYGCCPDGLTPAREPNGTDCPCYTLPFGCCPDNKTAAMGLNYFGCSCKTMLYDCCSDGITPAKGPNEVGCFCDSSQYGCCPDNRTSSKGWNYSGCPCSSFLYGCCPDNHTAATGPNNAGCSCRTMLYGCCYDGVTPAKGPNYEGCPCSASQYGCCQDGRTPAAGKNYKGCACHNTQFGCCADGYTAAIGPNYEGCPAIDSTENPIAERCSLAAERGPCYNYTVKWFFDTKLGSCQRFWYGGCEGSANRFNDEEDCKNACIISTKKVTDTPMDICRLPKKKGNCLVAVLRWYYDHLSEKCQQFYYTGCEGNENRFNTLAECEQRCSPKKGRDPCQLPLDAGNCANFRERWYYNSTTGECKTFLYSGCGGNDNNFDSYTACSTHCSKATVTDFPKEEFKLEHCLLDKDIGPCPNSELRWYYEKSSGVCREFFYGGCQGNHNRFQSHRECETKCAESQDICRLPQIRGSCNMAIVQWFYNHEEDECQQFVFTGCQGNGNRFSEQIACQERCKPSGKISTTAPHSQDRCSLPKDPGPCVGQHTAWYYDARLNTCRKFIYGGCDGNSNRFVARKNCELLCVKKHPKENYTTVTSPPESNADVCQMPPDRGDCNEVLRQWFYDSKSKTCLPFIYSGCGGNKNHFKTQQICMKFCSGLTSSMPIPDMKTKDELCPSSNCEELRCPLGKDEKIDEQGCVYCQCFNPCEIHICDEDSRCAIEMYRTADGEPRAQPLCRLMNKPGQCPTIESKAADPYASECIERCRLDSDCRNDRKCCFNGCTNVCMDPVHEIVDSVHHFDHPTEQDIIVKVGEPVFLVCPAIPSMSYHWSRNNASLPDDDPHIQILHNGTVYISSAEKYDASTFVCTTPGSTGIHIQHKFNLLVQAPARILPGPTLVLVQLAQPATLLCKAIGYPQPIVTWWKEQRMLPTSSSRYQQYPDHSLLIRSVAFPDAGIYTCQAYNGIGPMAILSITVHFSHSSDTVDSHDVTNVSHDMHKHNSSGGKKMNETLSKVSFQSTSITIPSSYDTENDVTPSSTPHPSSSPIVNKAKIIGGPTVYVNSGSTLNLTCMVMNVHSDYVFWYHNGNIISYDSQQGDISIITEKYPQTTSNLRITNAQPLNSGNYSCVPSNAESANIDVYVLSVDLSVEINEITPSPKTGSFMQLDCIASGSASLTVTWYFNNAVIQENDRIRILQNNTLTVSDIQVSHSGNYQCVARDNVNEASASVTITVKDDIPEDCIDNPFFANCELLVKANYCTNAVYAQHCCRSCTLAGQPPKS